MKKWMSLLLLTMMLCTLCMSACAEYNPAEFTDWFVDSQMWMTVNNGHWSHDPADKPTDEEIEKMLKAATLPQTAAGQTNTFFVVVKDVEDQHKIIGDKYCPVEQASTEGTVTILVMADNILMEDEGRLNPNLVWLGEKSRNQAFFDAGTATSALMTAAHSMGYYAHLWGSNIGPNAPWDLANGKYQSMSLYLKDDYTGKNGKTVEFGKEDEIAPENTIPVRGNYVLVCALVIGKPIAEEAVDVKSFATYHGRPERWAFFDGEYNEAPLANASYAVVEEAADTEIELADNEFVGVGQGMGTTLKVKVTVEDGKMTAVEVIQHQETPGISDSAISGIPEAILAAQSVEVDNVSGATVTSKAIKTAVADALARAGL